MGHRKYLFLLPIGMGVLLLIGMFFLWPAPAANAQCGSQASSCKNCHETQAKDPVNNDGTGWHQSHAFGDFCYMCHAGNNQSMDEEQAHAGMVPPLSDVQAGCASCHPDDLMDRAQVYASALGVEVGSGGGTTGGPAPAEGGDEGTNGEEPASQPAPPAMVVDSSLVVDYSRVYDETVLGVRVINWGNVILWLIILGVALGGGVFVYWNERRLRGLPFSPVKRPESKLRDSGAPVVEAPIVDGYASEVTSLLPLIARLNPQGLHALKKILADPEQANELLHSFSHLDPELVRRLRALDRDSRALLIAVAGD
jgi:hypothetical protein